MKLYSVAVYLCAILHAVHGITIYSARLDNGNYGTVEVLTHQGWLPVCSLYTNYWSTPESRVICRQLGYDVASTSSTSSRSTSLMFDFSCTGNEPKISDCSYTLTNSYTSSSCSPVFTVSCAQCTDGSVQLRGGVVPEAGTVEFCSGGVWRAVCDSNWDYKDAFVVCRELGLPATEVSTYSNSYFGDHPVTYGMYFNCFGNETSLNRCQKSTTTCDFANVAGIYCIGDVVAARCTEGRLQLVDGRDENEGRIEICSNGVWGTIYAGSWDVNDASVVCRQLGYQQYSRVEALRVSNGYFKGGTGSILFGNLQCTGTESRLTECSSSYYYSATHSDDAGVRCQRTAANTRICVDGEARLVNGSTASEGRVEICYAGIWGSVCDSSWDDQDAAIICMQLGFQGANATALSSSYFGDGDGPYHLSNVDCSGEERTLFECSNPYPIGYHTCTPGHDAGVRCDASVCAHNKLRLFRSNNGDRYGVAEICINGFWADICNSYTNIASKFCKEYLGNNSLSFGHSCCSGISRRNTGNLTLYDISCSGNLDIFTQDCSYSLLSGYSVGGCNLRNELIVGCYSQSTCTQNDIRLVGGNSSLEGRVEMCYENLWGAITYQIYHWDENDAMVACRQLGLPWEWALADQSDLFGRGNGRIVAVDYECTGSEQQLSSCYLRTYIPLSYGASNQQQSLSTVSVICQGNTSQPTECEHGDVRLVDGQTEMEGRVEFCAYGYWTVACDNYWDKDETNAVCKQLGFPTDASEYVLNSNVFGSNYQLPLIGLSCGSGASHISECQFHNQTSNCNHKRTAGIICKERNQHYQINVHASPQQDSYDIGSQVTLNCTANPSPRKYRNYGFLLTYHWYNVHNYNGGGWITSSSHTTFTVPLGLQHDSIDHYCSMYRNGLFLGTGQTTLHVRSVLQAKNTMSNFARIDTTRGQNFTLQVDTVNHGVVASLLELTWYNNDTLLVPGQDPQVSLSSDNKTLMVSNFTSTYAGVYRAQFNQLFVHPYNEECKNDFLSHMRSHPVLKPAVFCVNIEEKDYSDREVAAQNRITVSVQNSDIQGALSQNLSFKAVGIVSNSEVLKHSSFAWYRSGSQITPSLSSQQKHDSNLSLSEEFSLLDTSYEHTGRYEVLLRLDINSYLQEFGCQSYNDRFVATYLTSWITITKDYTDIYYHRGLTFNFDTEARAAARDKGATLNCQGSIEFPPFSMLSLIKNGQTVATSLSGMLQMSTKNVQANPFGFYNCHLNASGAIFKKSVFLEEQVTLRMTIDTGSSDNILCSESVIKEALLLKIRNECRCTFDESSIRDSSADCKNGEISYSATIQYSNEDGSETASTITERIIGQVPFSMTITGRSAGDQTVAVTVTSACTDCGTPLVLTAAAGGGLFIGGFVTAALIAGITIVVVMLVIRRRQHRNAADKPHHQIIKEESKADTTRYISPKVQKKKPASATTSTATGGGAKKLNKPHQEKKPAQHKGAKVDPKTHYDTPRAQKQSGHTSSKPAAQGVEMSQVQDVYEAMDPDRESIYEETF